MGVLEKITSKYLKLNKKRTMVTIIGIIISGAMVSGVFSLATSFQDFLIKTEEKDNGKWHAEFQNVPYESVKYIENSPNFSEVDLTVLDVTVENPYSDEPFMEVYAMDKKAMENMGVNLISGRLPENSKEIVISKTFFDGKENEPKVGDTITWNVGEVIEKEEAEEFQKTGEKTFTICGIIQHPRFEGGSEYTAALTFLDDAISLEGKNIKVGVQAKKVKNIYEDTEKIGKNLYGEEKVKYNIKYNSVVLAYMGVNRSDGFLVTLYGVCGVLILVIGIGSILVIYNSFAISVSERKKQFGMLSSVGATKKQIKKSVLYEGAILGGIGIPIGILAGVIGIGITLKIVNNLIQGVVAESGSVNLELSISWPLLLISAILIAFTIYLSVIIPARRASKISPMEAIRQTEDIKIKGKKVKTPKFIRKIFGEEGEIALKNLKRSKKRYRTTVISLIISIVLFITVNMFIGYMFKGFEGVYSTPEFDYKVTAMDRKKSERGKEAIEQMKNIEEIEELTITYAYYGLVKMPEEKISNDLKNAPKDSNLVRYLENNKTENGYEVSAEVIVLNKERFEKYLKEIGLNSLKENEIILINYINAMAEEHAEYYLSNYQEGDKITVSNGYIEEKERILDFEIAKVTNKMPFGITNSYTRFLLIVSEEGLERTEKELESGYTSYVAYMTADKKDREVVKQQIKQWQKEYADVNANYYDVQEEVETERNLKIIIQIFLYGFITLISLIGIANIFNTISTNINLRRREFANLKSIGMTDKQFRKMLDLECVFYGTKALLYGLPIAIFIGYLLNQFFGATATFIFELPWDSILICIISVYLVVFITMLYSSKKVKKENIIDALRDDNI